MLSHYSGIKMKGGTKIIKLPSNVSLELFNTENAFVGFAGSANDWGNTIQWFYNPENKLPKLKDIELLALTKKGIYHSVNISNWTQIKDKHFAIGSGMKYAIASMESGCSPKQAIKVASKYDEGTGMGIKEYKL